MKANKIKMRNFAQFWSDSGISAEGANHPLFVLLLVFLYGVFLFLAWFLNAFLGFGLCCLVLYFTGWPLRYNFWYPMSRHLSIYKYHRRLSLMGLNIYIINNFIFSPTGAMINNINAKFNELEEYLDGKSC